MIGEFNVPLALKKRLSQLGPFPNLLLPNMNTPKQTLFNLQPGDREGELASKMASCNPWTGHLRAVDLFDVSSSWDRWEGYQPDSRLR